MNTEAQKIISRNFYERNKKVLNERAKLKRRGLDFSHLKLVSIKKGRKPLPRFEASFNRLFYKYSQSAKERSIDFSLTQQELRALTSKNCYYCGCAPSQICANTGSKGQFNGNYVYNGIDRVNNSIGYTIKNCVSCCKACNYAKGDSNKQEFIYLVKKIVKNLKLC